MRFSSTLLPMNVPLPSVHGLSDVHVNSRAVSDVADRGSRKLILGYPSRKRKTKETHMVLSVGSPAPDFTLVDHLGEEVTLSEVLQDQPVVLVFFPLAFSGICTNELCELRDNLSLFADHKVR